MKRVAFLITFLAVGVLVAGGCAPAAAPTPAPTKAPATPAPPATPTKAAEAPAKPKMRLLMGTTAVGSSHYIYMTSAAKVINSKVPEVDVTPMETGGVVDNLARIRKDEIHLGLTNEEQRYQAINGLGRWKDGPIPDSRLLWVYTVTPCPPVVREDARITKIEDLEGKDFAGGPRGTGGEAGTKAYFEALDIKPKWYSGGAEDLLQAVRDRRIVGLGRCFAGPGIPDATLLDLQATVPIRVLPLTEAQMAKIKQKLPWFGVVKVEAGVYKAEWNKEPIPSYGVLGDVSTTTKLAEDLGYKFTKAIIEDNRPGGDGVQVAAFPAHKGVDLAKQTVELTNTPLHAGALKYYREIGLPTKDAHIPPEAKR